MQIASGNAGCKTGFNIIQDYVHDAQDTNNNQELEPVEINDILAALANVTTQGNNTMATTLEALTNTLQALNEKVDGIQEGNKRKKNNNSKFTVGLMVEPETKITSAVLATTRKKTIKIMQR